MIVQVKKVVLIIGLRMENKIPGSLRRSDQRLIPSAFCSIRNLIDQNILGSQQGHNFIRIVKIE